MTSTPDDKPKWLGKKVLIIDDEPDIVIYLESLLKDNGFITISAADGKEGMEKVLAEKPDLISLDISMPEESGVKMYRNLQENPDTVNIPVVIVTGISSDFRRFISHLERRKRVQPPAAYFEKPIEEKVFLTKIQQILS
jgi:CheY-like chemotaxis protein